MAAPTWLAATTGSPANAAQINQFLSSHAITYLYAGTAQAQQTTAGSGGVNSNGLYIAQTFVTGAGQTQIGYVTVTLILTGTPAPLTLQIQSDNAGNPSGTVLAQAAFPREFVAAGQLAVPLPCTVTATTTYHLVATAVGDASDYFTWSKSNQASGAQTSSNGSTWTSQTYGLLFQVFDQSLVSPLKLVYEDAGARWTKLLYDGNSRLQQILEYTAGQTAAGYTASTRTLSYGTSPSGTLTGVV